MAVPEPDLAALLPSLLASLPTATASPTPPAALLQHLSPILRQRIQYLTFSPEKSDTTSPSWLPLLCYTVPKAQKLATTIAANGDRFEPHPVSGEVEVDWEYDANVRYRRLDRETLQACVSLSSFGIAVRLVYCAGDSGGDGSESGTGGQGLGDDGWRIGEVDPLEPRELDDWPCLSIAEAEEKFKRGAGHGAVPSPASERLLGHQSGGWRGTGSHGSLMGGNDAYDNGNEAGDEDDGYWDQYDKTPADTPAPGRSPAPPSGRGSISAPMSANRGQTTNDFTGFGTGPSDGTYASSRRNDSITAEDAYYARYGSVQPALDQDDPDEAIMDGAVETTLGRPQSLAGQDVVNKNRSLPFSQSDGTTHQDVHMAENQIMHPRPRSSGSNSSGRSLTVEHLERAVENQDTSGSTSHKTRHHHQRSGDHSSDGQGSDKGSDAGDMAIKQHLATSVKSLWRLARAAGIQRREFERCVRTELELLGLSDEE